MEPATLEMSEFGSVSVIFAFTLVIGAIGFVSFSLAKTFKDFTRIRAESHEILETEMLAEDLPETLADDVLTNDEEDVDNDYKYQRENFYNLIERGQDAIDGILDLARESEHPRTYEVAGNLIKQVAEVTEKLGDLQGKMKKLKEVPNSAPKNVTNALFVGSTAELQKMLKGK